MSKQYATIETVRIKGSWKHVWNETSFVAISQNIQILCADITLFIYDVQSYW